MGREPLTSPAVKWQGKHRVWGKHSTPQQSIYANISFKICYMLWIVHTSAKTRVQEGLRNIANSGYNRWNVSKFKRHVQRTHEQCRKSLEKLLGMLKHHRCRCNRKWNPDLLHSATHTLQLHQAMKTQTKEDMNQHAKSLKNISLWLKWRKKGSIMTSKK